MKRLKNQKKERNMWCGLKDANNVVCLCTQGRGGRFFATVKEWDKSVR
jgi:hypothetical protein